MAGRTGYTAYDNDSSYDPPTDLTDVAAHFDALIGETVDTASNLPTSGNWKGRMVMAEDTKVVYLCTATPNTWEPVSRPAQRQLDTTNDALRLHTQVGVGKIVGNGTASLTEAVTFPSAFSEIPVVQANFIGYRAAGAFNRSGLLHTGGPVVSLSGCSTTGFDVRFYISTTFSASFDWYYSWTALGPI